MSEAATKTNQFKPRTFTQQQWLDHFKRCDSSGLTVAAYVRSQGLKLATYYRWRQRLLPGQVDQSPAVTPSPYSEANALPLSGPAFHPVKIKPDELSSVGTPAIISMRFRLPNGIDCELAGLSPDTCSAFLESLSRLRL